LPLGVGKVLPKSLAGPLAGLFGRSPRLALAGADAGLADGAAGADRPVFDDGGEFSPKKKANVLQITDDAAGGTASEYIRSIPTARPADTNEHG